MFVNSKAKLSYTLGLLLILCVISKNSRSEECVYKALTATMEDSDCKYLSNDPSPTDALVSVRGTYISVIGESTLRQQFEQMEGLLHNQPVLLVEDHKEEHVQTVRVSNAVLRFSYESYFANATAWLKKPVTWFDRNPDLVILQCGLHDLLYNYESFQADFDDLVEQIKIIDFPVLFQLMPPLRDSSLEGHRKDASQFRSANVKELNTEMESKLRTLENVFVMDMYNEDATNVEFTKDGVHNMIRARSEAKGLVKAVSILRQDSSVFKVETLTAGQIMFFLVYLFVACNYFPGEVGLKLFKKKKLVSVVIEKDEEEQETLVQEKENKQTEEKSPMQEVIVLETPTGVPFMREYLEFYESYREGFKNGFYFFGVCFLVFLMDGPYWRPFNPALKKYDRDFFLFLHILVLVAAYLTLRPTFRNNDVILNLDQTGEWKGIMQIIFVMYHYFDAAEIYNLIRVLIAAYVWMTGYGNTCFFLNPKKKGKAFTWTRLFQMFFRLNWLVFWVCLVLDQPLMLYYICPLHTFFFFFTFALCWVGHTNNESTIFFVCKLIGGFLFLFILFDVDGVFEIVFSPLGFLLDFYGSMHEWKFRSTLDHYQTFYGICCAFFLMPAFKKLWAYAEEKDRVTHITTKSLFVAPWLGLATYWYCVIYPKPKFDYNALHPYTAWIPVSVYIILRNTYQPSRTWYSYFLGWLGAITLETYIFQYHLYLQDDAKSIVTIFDGYPLVNFVILSCFYVACSKVAFNSTAGLKTFCFPNISDKPGSEHADTDNLKRFCIIVFALAVMFGFSKLLLVSFLE